MESYLTAAEQIRGRKVPLTFPTIWRAHWAAKRGLDAAKVAGPGGVDPQLDP